jgi:hypothetical protein
MASRISPIHCRLSFATLVLLGVSQLVAPRLAMTQENKSMSLEIDHAVICGSNLDALRQSFTDAGLTPDFGGPHGNGLTQMAILGFDDGSYIELLAPAKAGSAEGSVWAKFTSVDAVTCAWAVGTNVLLQQVDQLKKAGIPVNAPERGSRKRPDGMSVEWMAADVGTGTPGATLPFIIEDQTPREWRVQTSASVKGAPVGGVESVVIGVSNLDASIALFRKAYGWSAPLVETEKDFGKVAYFPGEPVMLASGGGWLAEHISKFGESPVAYLLSASDLAAATKKYKLGGMKMWFGQKVVWFDAAKLKGLRLGVIGQ